MLYTAGVGGEIITYALSQCVPQLNSLITTDVSKNRWFTICKKSYCRDRNPPWEYKGENDPKKSDLYNCLLYTSPSPRDTEVSRMPSSA